MSFKGWLLVEDIIIQEYGHLATLVPAEGPNMEFHYQWDNGYASYYIGCYQARREGYVSLSSRPTHVGVIKTDAIEQREGIDIGFIKNLTAIFKKQGLKGVPYREGGRTGFDNLFKQVGFQSEEQPEEPFTTGHEVPDFETGKKNMTPLTPSGGISVSRASGSWAFFVSAQETQNYMIKAILDAMKQAAKPLLDNDLIDYCEIVDRKSMSRSEVLYSKKGKTDEDDWKGAFKKAIAQLKYLIVTYLVGMPKYKTELLDIINRYPDAKETNPQQTWASWAALEKLNDHSYNDNALLSRFFDALKSGDKDRLAALEKLAVWAEKQPKGNTYWIGGGAEKLGWIWNRDKDAVSEKQGGVLAKYTRGEDVVADMVGSGVLDHLSTVASFMKYEDLLQQVEPEYYQYIKDHIKVAIEQAFEEDEEAVRHLDRGDILNLNDIAGKLRLNPAIIHAMEQGAEKIKTAEAEAHKKRLAERIKNSYLMPIDGSAYMMLGEDEELHSAHKYVDYRGDFDVGELAEDLVGDEEGVFYDAMERAEKDAYDDVLERPSETYGEDDNEVEEDIGYEWWEFADENNIEEIKQKEIPEELSEEDAIQIVKDNYYKQFIKWKKEEMREKEDRDGRYEVDTESSEFNEKVSEYKKEVAEEYAWEKGLVTIKRDEKEVEIQLHKTHWEKFKPTFKKLLEINLHTKDNDDDEYFKASTRITVDLLPDEGDRKSAYDWLRDLAGRTY